MTDRQHHVHIVGFQDFFVQGRCWCGWKTEILYEEYEVSRMFWRMNLAAIKHENEENRET